MEKLLFYPYDAHSGLHRGMDKIFFRRSLTISGVRSRKWLSYDVLSFGMKWSVFKKLMAIMVILLDLLLSCLIILPMDLHILMQELEVYSLLCNVVALLWVSLIILLLRKGECMVWTSLSLE